MTRPLPIHVEVLRTPVLARADGGDYFVYELHLTNCYRRDFVLEARLVDNLKHFPAAEEDASLAGYTVVGGSEPEAPTVANTLAFAGEAFADETNGTVEGALETGVAAAERLLRSLERT